MLLLQCLFSRFKKYLLFFSPSLYHLVLLLIMHHFVLCLFISSNACILLVSSLIVVSFSSFDKSFRSSFRSWWEISASNSASVFFSFAFNAGVLKRPFSYFKLDHFPQQRVINSVVTFIFLRHFRYSFFDSIYILFVNLRAGRLERSWAESAYRFQSEFFVLQTKLNYLQRLVFI